MTETAEASTVSPPALTQVFIPLSNLPPPKALIFDDNLATAWKSWKTAWQCYEIATGVHKQEGIVRVSTLLSIIDEDGVKAHDTFTWNEDENTDDISQVLKKFDDFCTPRTQVIRTLSVQQPKAGTRRKHFDLSYGASNDREKLRTRHNHTRWNIAWPPHTRHTGGSRARETSSFEWFISPTSSRH